MQQPHYMQAATSLPRASI